MENETPVADALSSSVYNMKTIVRNLRSSTLCDEASFLDMLSSKIEKHVVVAITKSDDNINKQCVKNWKLFMIFYVPLLLKKENIKT